MFFGLSLLLAHPSSICMYMCIRTLCMGHIWRPSVYLHILNTMLACYFVVYGVRPFCKGAPKLKGGLGL